MYKTFSVYMLIFLTRSECVCFAHNSSRNKRRIARHTVKLFCRKRKRSISRTSDERWVVVVEKVMMVVVKAVVVVVVVEARVSRSGTSEVEVVASRNSSIMDW